jgi:HD-GYP domain-containing protein (c-di-GMP phosphodiesterase class II)
MRSPTSKLRRRLPITSQRQPLRFVVYSTNTDRRAGLLAALANCALVSKDRDTVIDVSSPDQSGQFTVSLGTCLLIDVDSPSLPHAELEERSPSSVVATFGATAAGGTVEVPEFDDHVVLPAAAHDMERFVRRVRELAWLRSRALSEGATTASRDKLARLNRIGTALSDVRVLNDLLHVVLTEARNILDADAGSIYIIESGRGSSMSGRKVLGRAERRTKAVAVKRTAIMTQQLTLRFAAAQNDSRDIPFQEILFPANMESIAGYAALTGEIVALEDVYHLPPNAPFKFNKYIDETYGYRTRSMLTVPLKNTQDEVVGVVQLINKKKNPLRKLEQGIDPVDEVIPFNDEDLELANSLGSQAGVAIENVRLMDSIAHLFERFVIACVQAVEQRDPATAGHSGRVDRLTMAIADEVNRAKEGVYANVTFSDEEMTELHYASLLHDFGKIGVREHVLTKAEKLYPAQQQAIEFRAAIIDRELQLDALEHEAALYAEGKANKDALQALRQQRDEKLAKLAGQTALLRKHFKPIFVTDEAEAAIRAIHANPWRIRGQDYRLIDDDELISLCTKRGTLNPEERKEIENHVADSWSFLKRIPWTEDLARVPEIAGQHHEKMKGGGYPNGVKAGETPLGSRIMAVADVFDSLTASDRPYKPAIPLERALQILQSMADEGDLDPDVVKLMIDTKIWEKLKLKVVRLADATESQRLAR